MKGRPYRTLFLGSLVQDSALSVGGSAGEITPTDGPICRDGANRPTLRGTGLAGALVATLRRLVDEVPAEISCAENGHRASAWRTFNSHADISGTELRQHVAINPATGAAEDSALYDVETLPRGTRWPFLLEVDTYRSPELDSAGLARAVLSEWEAGRCWLGREVARGMGWMRLEDLKSYVLGIEDADHWPSAEYAHNYPAYIAQRFASRIAEISCHHPLARKPYAEISGKCIAGMQSTESWGLDSLSVGSHATEEWSAEWDDQYLTPSEMDPVHQTATFAPDVRVASMPGAASRIPFIPGSSLRGPLRHALTRLLRARNKSTDLADILFGTTERSGKLLIRDALPIGECRLAWMQMHAEDEFSSGTYSSGKFDRVAVLEGSFEWKMYLEAESQDELRSLLLGGLSPLRKLAQAGQLALGGSQWRGHGWLRWEVTKSLIERGQGTGRIS